MELPISFFLDYAWNPPKWNETNISRYYYKWAAQQFDSANAIRIGNVLRSYAQYSARKKPELLSAETYSLNNYNEAEQVTASWKLLRDEAEKIGHSLPAASQDAYFQLVLHPVKAMTNLHEMYFAQALNQRYASKKTERANFYAKEVSRLYHVDEEITSAYHQVAGGKWNHMMDQTHIGYTNWQQPPENKMPAVVRIADPSQTEVELTEKKDVIQDTKAYSVVSRGIKDVSLFYETGGYISINAVHSTRQFSTNSVQWKVIPDIGRNSDGVTTFPVTASATLSPNSPHLDYDFYTNDTGSFKLQLYFSPTLNIYGDEGLKYAVSIDDGTQQLQVLNEGEKNTRTWEKWVADNIIIKTSTHTIKERGKHILHFWMISPGVVLQKIVLDFGGVKPSYLGPPETKY